MVISRLFLPSRIGGATAASDAPQVHECRRSLPRVRSPVDDHWCLARTKQRLVRPQAFMGSALYLAGERIIRLGQGSVSFSESLIDLFYSDLLLDPSTENHVLSSSRRQGCGYSRRSATGPILRFPGTGNDTVLPETVCLGHVSLWI